MKLRSLIVPSICLVLGAGIPALANWAALDGNRNPISFLSLNIGGNQEQQVSPSDASGNPFNQANPQFFNLELNNATLSAGQQTKSASLPIVGPSDPDVRPSTGNISAVDSASVTTTGQGGSNIVTGTPSANSSVTQAVNGTSTARIQVSGTWSGATLALEQSIDGGTTYGAMGCHVNGAPAIVNLVSSITANGMLECEVAGATNVRLRATAFGSGSAVVTMAFTRFAGSVKVTNTAMTSAQGVTSTDASGTIATGGSYQTLAAASMTRKGCMIHNPATATEILNVKFGSMTQPFTLNAGGTFNCKSGDVVLQDSITVMGATTGHAFAAILN